MSVKKLEIKLTRNGRVAPNQNVVFDEETMSTPEIAYDFDTGEIKINAIGEYSIKWWVATETTSRGALEFGLLSSQGDSIRGSSPVKTGHVSGFAAIDVQTIGTTLRLVNATADNIVYSREVVTKAYLLLLSAESIGPTGPEGSMGGIGPTGPDGSKGDIGPAGPDGPRGGIGPTGKTGDDGPIGDAGPSGPTGPQGMTGAVGTILASYDTLEELEAAQPTGESGEFYYVNPHLYAWDEDKNEWFIVGDLAGPQGLEGPTGSNGDTGAAGDTGPTGLTGADGADGAIGPTGDDGVSATINIGVVKPVFSGTPPTVTNSGTDSTVVLNFGIPSTFVVYRASLTSSANVLEIPLKNVTLRFTGNNTSTLRVYMVTTQQIYVDYRQVTQLDERYEQAISNGRLINGTLSDLGTIRNQATARWTLLLRQQDPISGFWTLHEVILYSTGNGARTTAWATLLDDDVDYDNPINPSVVEIKYHEMTHEQAALKGGANER